jgi:hypothetical protein
MSEYEPTQEDMDWARMVLGTIRDGGTWVAPATGSIYHIDHTNQTITLQSSLDVHDKSKVFERTVIVFGKLGYKVTKSN